MFGNNYIYFVFISILFFCFMNHSLYKILTLLMNISILMFLYSYELKISWYMIMYMILMSSGLLVLFFYVTSLVSNKHSFFNKNLFLLSYFMIILFYSKMNLSFIYSFEFNYFMTFCNLNLCFLALFLIIYMFLMLLLNMEMLLNFKNSFRMF